jgi:DNA polymerase III epsilon subunit-like protein
MRMAQARIGIMALDDVCDKLGIDRRHRTKHGALIDARLCAEAFRKLSSRRRS